MLFVKISDYEMISIVCATIKNNKQTKATLITIAVVKSSTTQNCTHVF